MKLPELKELMKQHNIRGHSYLNKPQMISRLVEKGVLTLEVVENWKQPPKVTSKDEKYDRLKRIRTHPRRVEILDRETGLIDSYSSMYKAAKALNQNAGVIPMFNGKVYKKRYEIKVLESEDKDLINFEESEEETSSSSEESMSDESTSEEECSDESATRYECVTSDESASEESGSSEESTRGVKIHIVPESSEERTIKEGVAAVLKRVLQGMSA